MSEGHTTTTKQSRGGKPDKGDKRCLQYDTAAMFEAVEQQDLDLVRSILDSGSCDVNSLNQEQLSVLDIAIMTNNIPVAKLLLARGAKESPICEC